MNINVNNVAVFGLGLLGGSLCRILKMIYPHVRISAYGRNLDKLKPALDDNTVDTINLIEKADIALCDFIIVSTPVLSSIDVLKRILNDDNLRDDALIIDVGSVKGEIVSNMLELERAGQFVGCHPMTGSEKSGYSHFDPTLFEHASVIITPHQKNKDSDIKRVEAFWFSLKSVPFIISPEKHDLIVAFTSHLPHFVSCVMADNVKKLIENRFHDDEIRQFIGSGFKDITRLASGSPEMWNEIISLNSENIISALDTIIDDFNHLRDIMLSTKKDNRIHEYLKEIKEFRDTIL